MTVDVLAPHEWAPFSAQAHLVAFGESKPASWDRIDFVLTATEKDTPLGYVTGRFMDHESVYWQYGGVMPGTRGSSAAWRVLQAFIGVTQRKHKRMSFLVENTNVPMLKMAMKAGFRIVGIRNFKGSILLEHLLEFEGGN